MHVRIAVAWVVILAVVGFVVYTNIQRAEKTAGFQVNDLRLKIAAQEAIGLKYMQRSLKTPVNALDPLLHTLDRNASTPEDAFHVAIIAGEVRDAATAIA